MLQLHQKKTRRIITKVVVQREVESHILSCLLYIALLSLHFTIYGMVDSKFIQTPPPRDGRYVAKIYGPDTFFFIKKEINFERNIYKNPKPKKNQG